MLTCWSCGCFALIFWHILTRPTWKTIENTVWKLNLALLYENGSGVLSLHLGANIVLGKTPCPKLNCNFKEEYIFYSFLEISTFKIVSLIHNFLNCFNLVEALQGCKYMFLKSISEPFDYMSWLLDSPISGISAVYLKQDKRLKHNLPFLLL